MRMRPLEIRIWQLVPLAHEHGVCRIRTYLTDFLMMNFNICLYRFPSHLQIRVPLPVRDERLADDLLCVRAANADREE